MKSKDYVSEYEQFMNGFLHDHPEVERDQRRGWRIWWERPARTVDPARESDAVPRAGYYYD